MIPYNANIVGSFPNTTIDLIISLPTYETLNSIHLKINQNTDSVDSNLGDGIIGLLPLTVSTAVYNNLLETPFVIPNNRSSRYGHRKRHPNISWRVSSH